ncbi:MAG: Hpt domain-containing protein, partial [Planctomycetes bacterium]|nr:Hpt domain-containing protein [Planctomycetota bacterium]
EATRKIRQDSRSANLPILAMTANAMAGDREKCLDCGMNDHIAKPIDVSQLFVTLARWIRPAATAAPEQAPKAAATNGVPVISGLETVQALARMGGNAGLLKKLIFRFGETQGSAMGRIRAALASGDRTTATREAHTVKGLAGNIGATHMAESAALVEKMLEHGETAGLEQRMADMDAELGSVVARIATALGVPEKAPVQPPASPVAVDKRALAEDLGRLGTLLADSDAEAVTLAEGLEERLRSLGQQVAAGQLSKQAAEFDFEGALKSLWEIARGLNLAPPTGAQA